MSERDAPPWAGDEQTWTRAWNVRGGAGAVREVRGPRPVLDVGQTIEALLFCEDRWVIGVEGKLLVWDGEVLRTGGTYGTGEWALTGFGGVPIATNGSDPPQYQEGYGSFRELPEWPAGLRAKRLVPFRNYLVAMGLSGSGTAWPHTVRWSHPAAPGEVPITWDVGDPTKDAGEVSLTDEESGEIVDGLALGDSLMIYKRGAVWRMRFIGPPFIFEFQKVFGGLGALGPGCVAPIKEGMAHAVFTEDRDLVVHDGQVSKSVASGGFRELVRGLGRPKLLARPAVKELWMFFPEMTATWNWETGFFSLVGIGGVSAVAPGAVPRKVRYWDEEGEVWDRKEGVWDAGEVGRGTALDAVARGSWLEELEGGEVLPARLERLFVPTGAEQGVRFLLRRVDPLARPFPVVEVATHDRWQTAGGFSEVVYRPWCPTSGPAFSFRVSFSGPFEMTGVDYDVVPVGVAPVS